MRRVDAPARCTLTDRTLPQTVLLRTINNIISEVVSAKQSFGHAQGPAAAAAAAA